MEPRPPNRQSSLTSSARGRNVVAELTVRHVEVSVARLFNTFVLIAGSVAFLAAVPLQAAAGQQKMVNVGPDNVAIQGYDPVAYFTEGAPTKGSPEYAFTWNDAEWHFTSVEHRDMFAANPEHYAPQFGGFCSVAMTKGVKVDADPHFWTIVDGKLYLKFSKRGLEEFRQNPRQYIRKAEDHWAELQHQN